MPVTNKNILFSKYFYWIKALDLSIAFRDLPTRRNIDQTSIFYHLFFRKYYFICRKKQRSMWFWFKKNMFTKWYKTVSGCSFVVPTQLKKYVLILLLDQLNLVGPSLQTSRLQAREILFRVWILRSILQSHLLNKPRPAAGRK
jgi:hypothetical protein